MYLHYTRLRLLPSSNEHSLSRPTNYTLNPLECKQEESDLIAYYCRDNKDCTLDWIRWHIRINLLPVTSWKQIWLHVMLPWFTCDEFIWTELLLTNNQVCQWLSWTHHNIICKLWISNTASNTYRSIILYFGNLKCGHYILHVNIFKVTNWKTALLT